MHNNESYRNILIYIFLYIQRRNYDYKNKCVKNTDFGVVKKKSFLNLLPTSASLKGAKTNFDEIEVNYIMNCNQL